MSRGRGKKPNLRQSPLQRQVASARVLTNYKPETYAKVNPLSFKNISERLAVENPRGKYAKQVLTAAAAIDRTHRVSNLPKLQVFWSSAKTYSKKTEFDLLALRTSADVTISRKHNIADNFLDHVAYMIDRKMIPQKGVHLFASNSDHPLIKNWEKAVASSRFYQDMLSQSDKAKEINDKDAKTKIKKFSGFDKQELFKSSYIMWLKNKKGNEDLAAILPQYSLWQPEDFDRISLALDHIFEPWMK